MILGKLYNKKYLYVEWDDVLNRKDVLLADGIVDLKNRDVAFYKVANNSDNSENFPFQTADKENISFRMAYYDPNLIYKIRFLDGVKIKVFQKSNNLCVGTVNKLEMFDNDEDFYFAVDEEKKDGHIPFDTVEALIEYWIKKNNISLICDYNPFIWVRWKINRMEMLITGYDRENDTVYICNDAVSMKELFERFEFLDGSPCGGKV